MDITKAMQELDAIVEEIERDGFATLDMEDRAALLKAIAALETCQQLGGR